MNLVVAVEGKQLASDALLRALDDELGELESIRVERRTVKPPEGTLDIDADTVALILRIGTQGLVMVRELVKLLRETREREISQNVNVPKDSRLVIYVEGQPAKVLRLPASEKAIKEFLSSLDS
jgi:hypothetical protein